LKLDGWDVAPHPLHLRLRPLFLGRNFAARVGVAITFTLDIQLQVHVQHSEKGGRLIHSMSVTASRSLVHRRRAARHRGGRSVGDDGEMHGSHGGEAGGGGRRGSTPHPRALRVIEQAASGEQRNKIGGALSCWCVFQRPDTNPPRVNPPASGSVVGVLTYRNSAPSVMVNACVGRPTL
jgi:hypothetical protein